MYVSSLLDRSKCGKLAGTSWFDKLQMVPVLIQLMISEEGAGQGSAALEFEHFYQILMSTRLLRGRYHSLALEEDMMKLLPVMPKVKQMLEDIQKTNKNMLSFKKYVLSKSGSNALAMLPSTAKLLLEKGALLLYIFL